MGTRCPTFLAVYRIVNDIIATPSHVLHELDGGGPVDGDTERSLISTAIHEMEEHIKIKCHCVARGSQYLIIGILHEFQFYAHTQKIIKSRLEMGAAAAAAAAAETVSAHSDRKCDKMVVDENIAPDEEDPELAAIAAATKDPDAKQNKSRFDWGSPTPNSSDIMNCVRLSNALERAVISWEKAVYAERKYMTTYQMDKFKIPLRLASVFYAASLHQLPALQVRVAKLAHRIATDIFSNSNPLFTCQAFYWLVRVYLDTDNTSRARRIFEMYDSLISSATPLKVPEESFEYKQLFLSRLELDLLSNGGGKSSVSDPLKTFLESDYVKSVTLNRYMVKCQALNLATRLYGCEFPFSDGYTEFTEPLQIVISIVKSINRQPFMNLQPPETPRKAKSSSSDSSSSSSGAAEYPKWYIWSTLDLALRSMEVAASFQLHSGLVYDLIVPYALLSELARSVGSLFWVCRLGLVGVELDLICAKTSCARRKLYGTIDALTLSVDCPATSSTDNRPMNKNSCEKWRPPSNLSEETFESDPSKPSISSQQETDDFAISSSKAFHIGDDENGPLEADECRHLKPANKMELRRLFTSKGSRRCVDDENEEESSSRFTFNVRSPNAQLSKSVKDFPFARLLLFECSSLELDLLNSNPTQKSGNSDRLLVEFRKWMAELEPLMEGFHLLQKNRTHPLVYRVHLQITSRLAQIYLTTATTIPETLQRAIETIEKFIFLGVDKKMLVRVFTYQNRASLADLLLLYVKCLFAAQVDRPEAVKYLRYKPLAERPRVLGSHLSQNSSRTPSPPRRRGHGGTSQTTIKKCHEKAPQRRPIFRESPLKEYLDELKYEDGALSSSLVKQLRFPSKGKSPKKTSRRGAGACETGNVIKTTKISLRTASATKYKALATTRQLSAVALARDSSIHDQVLDGENAESSERKNPFEDILTMDAMMTMPKGTHKKLPKKCLIRPTPNAQAADMKETENRSQSLFEVTDSGIATTSEIPSGLMSVTNEMITTGLSSTSMMTSSVTVSDSSQTSATLARLRGMMNTAAKMMGSHPPFRFYREAHSLLWRFNSCTSLSSASLHFAESISAATLRYRTLLSLPRKAATSTAGYHLHVDSLRFSSNLVSTKSSDLQAALNCLPASWRVLQVVSEPSSPNSAEAIPHLYLSRLQKGKSPVMVHIEANPDRFTRHFMTELQEIITLSSASIKNIADRETYWRVRNTLDERLRLLVGDVQAAWLGPFIGLFLGQPTDRNYLDFVESLVGNIIWFGNKHGVKLAHRPLLDVLIESAPLLSAEQFKSGLEAIYNSASSSSAEISREKMDGFLSECHQYWTSKFESSFASKSSRKKVFHNSGHVALIVNTPLERFPWEALPIYEETTSSSSSSSSSAPIFRVPSLAYLLALVRGQVGVAESLYERGARPSSCYYLLDSEGNLPRTRQFFAAALRTHEHAYGWSGLVGSEPSGEDFHAALTRRDVYMYLGHGAGTRYFRSLPDGFDSTALRSLGLVIGCSSGHLLVESPHLESYGTAWRYLMNGGPAFAGVLWDVTDRDIDRYTDELLSLWLPTWKKLKRTANMTEEEDINTLDKDSSKSTMPNNNDGDRHGQEEGGHHDLAAAMAAARASCRLKHLCGAGPILYGLPIACRGHH